MDKGWLCFVTAGTAACMDLEKEKVENGWLLYSAVFSLLNRAAAEGTDGVVSALGSDCHNTDSRRPNLDRCFSVITKKCGEQAVENIMDRSKKLLGL